MLTIQTNVIALGAIRSINLANAQVIEASQRLASGYRINSASDDPSGLMISEKLRAQMKSYEQAISNASQGVSLTETASDGLSEIANILSEMRSLAVSSATDTLNGSTREQLQADFQDYIDEINAIANATSFNDINPLRDDSLQVDIQVGIEGNADNVITISGVNAVASALGLSSLTVSTEAGASASITGLDSAIDYISGLNAAFGAVTNRLEARSRLLAGQLEHTGNANSAIRDADAALESARLTRYQVVQESAIAVLTQANANHRLALSLLGAT